MLNVAKKYPLVFLVIEASVLGMLALVARVPQKGFQWATDIVGVSPSLFTDEGADWGRSRRLVAPPLSGHNVRKMVPAITKVRLSDLSLPRGLIKAFAHIA